MIDIQFLTIYRVFSSLRGLKLSIFIRFKLSFIKKRLGDPVSFFLWRIDGLRLDQ